MKPRGSPLDEKGRFEAIRRYHIMDTEDEQEYDDVVELASQLCNAPIAIITLLDENRQWFKAKKGLDIRETPISISFCSYTIRHDKLMVVNDTLTDGRFSKNPLVTGDPHIRFYAGMPLITSEGFRLGTLAVIDRVARNISDAQIKGLQILARQVVNLLNLRVKNVQLSDLIEEKTSEVLDILQRINDAFLAVDKNWSVTYINEKASQITKRLPKDIIGKNIWEEFPEAFYSEFPERAERAMLTQQNQNWEAFFEPYNLWFETHLYPSPTGLSIYFRDITERKDAEFAIKHSEEIRRLIMDSSLDAIVSINADGIITFWNPQAENIFGWKETEIVGKSLTDTIIPEQFREQHKNGLKRYQENNSGPILNKIIELNALNKKGAEFPIELTISPIKQNNSEFFCAFIRDISEKKKAEEALRASEANYRRLIEGNPQPMWIYDIDSLRILEVNEAAISKYGYTRSEFLKMTIKDLRPEEEILKVTEFLKTLQLDNKGLTQSGPWKHRLKNGELIDVEITSHAINWQGHKARFTLAWDVTKRLQMETSLRKAEEQYRSIFENAIEGIYQSTPEGKFIAVNPALAKMFGYSSTEDMIRSVTDIGAQLYADPADRLHMKTLLEKNGAAYGLEFKGLKTNNEVIWVRNHIRAVYNENGMIKFFEGTLEDITERKKVEENLNIQFAELQKTNQELDRFVYSASHDLRAPLATILGLINVAEMESPSPRFQEYLNMIKNNINRLDGFINDILNYSLNSRKDIKIEKIEFDSLIQEARNNLLFINGCNRLTFNVDISDNGPFFSDRQRLLILFNNLLSNSIKYQDVTKDSSMVIIKVTTSPEKALITFSDNGIGIEKWHLDKIFGMFYRASEHSKGSGLGLYIAKETIAKLGGSIAVESEFGAHTTFEIVIPNSQQ